MFLFEQKDKKVQQISQVKFPLRVINELFYQQTKDTKKTRWKIWLIPAKGHTRKRISKTTTNCHFE